MLYYRRKIILALIELCDGQVTAKRLQKLLFLFTRLQSTKAFDFVPYKYGCFSFQANQDISTLTTYGYVSLNDTDNGRYIKLEKQDDYVSLLNKDDIKSIKSTFLEFGKMKQAELIKYTYQKYPFYAINSSIASDIMSNAELDIIAAQRRHFEETVLFSIGYEGVSLERYINTLIIKDVRVLCDVRKNAFSQKYGFSKKQLQAACTGVGIAYLHMPELGIESSDRQELKTQKDYDSLFDTYERNTLSNREVELKKLLSVIGDNKRIALTCFEKDPRQCHRTRVANELVKLSNGKLKLTNL